MNFKYSTFSLNLKHRFTIARGSEEVIPIILVYFMKDGITGVGEAAPSIRYGEDFVRVARYLSRLTIKDMPSDGSLNDWLDWAMIKAGGNHSLEAAFDLALHDLHGKLNDKSTSTYFRSDQDVSCLTSFTIGIDDKEKIKQKVREADIYPLLKVKLGSNHDKQIITTIREVTDKLIRVDANEGWNLEEGKRMCDWLADRNVEFIEQPLPAINIEDTARLKEYSPLEIIADENCIDSNSIPIIADAFDGINIKLMKCGGLREAHKMIKIAKARGMKIMLGCMVETSVAITAASMLSPFADYADLDGNILTKNDPFNGVLIENGKLILPEGPGLGISLKK